MEQEKVLRDAQQMARTICRMCMRDRPCGREECVAYDYSDQEGKDQARRKQMVAEADERTGK
jgi:hypothetical protein